MSENEAVPPQPSSPAPEASQPPAAAEQPPVETQQTKTEMSVADKALKVATPIKKKKSRPPQPEYISRVEKKMDDMNAALAAMRAEKEARRKAKEESRKKVTFREEAHSSGAENAEEAVTQHAPQPEVVGEEAEEEPMDLQTDEVVDDESPDEPPNPFLKRMSRPL